MSFQSNDDADRAPGRRAPGGVRRVEIIWELVPPVPPKRAAQGAVLGRIKPKS